jgi:methionine-S-sulfoxide reductase
MKNTLMLMIMAASVAAFGAENKEDAKMEKAIVAGGCFWGVEALFQELDGVVDTSVGYTGGHTENPIYRDICGHGTGHAEAAEIVYDPAKVTYEEILAYFWRLHDPTTMNRQGRDVGDQYRSAIFYLSPEQKAAADKAQIEAQKNWKKPIVTEIVPATIFYPAEDYHQDYFKKHGVHGCHFLRD